MSRREDALALIGTVVPSDYGDPQFFRVIGDMYREGPGAGTTCGFLPSFILLMLGCIEPAIINRTAAEYGLYYRIGQNISRLVNGARQLGAWVDGDEGIRAGDVFFVSNGPPATEHVGHLFHDGGEFWTTACAGQRNAAGHQAARFVIRPKEPGRLWTPNGWKKVQGYIDLDRLPYNAASAPNVPAGFPTQIVTEADGVMDIERDYLPRVVTGEDGAGPSAALEAQAIAARTYLLRAMLDDPALGTAAKPVRNSPKSFQVYAASATAPSIAATQATAGIVATYRGALILATYVSGALRTAEGAIGDDPTKTEQYVTYNEGKTGSSVQPTSQVSRAHPQNRGSMGQKCANWLAAHGYDHERILRYFYGQDLELTDVRGAVPSPGRAVPRPPGPSPEGSEGDEGDDGSTFLAMAGAGLAWAFFRKG